MADPLPPPPPSDSDGFSGWLFKLWKLVTTPISGFVPVGAWSSSGITGTASTVAAFDSSGVATNLTESGTGNVARTTSPVFTTPNIGSATGSISGNAGTVTTNANLTGPVTSSGNATTITANAVTTTTINAAAVTYAKIQNVAALSVFGRSANSAGVGADITGTTNQALVVNGAGTGLGFGSVALLGVATGTSLALTDFLTVSGAASGNGIGYATGAGGTVTQITSKATGVTINKMTGRITTINSALLAGAQVTFVVSNSLVNQTDNVIVTHCNASASGSGYCLQTVNIQGGGFSITITNLTSGSLSEAIAINFAVIKGATS